MNRLDDLLDNNRAWAERVSREDPTFFERLSHQQSPKYLWIGCSDSRVPANQVVGMMPGEIFVHRNVANVVVHADLNCLAAIQFAVDLLRVEHIIVCGHYGCGGIQAAVTNNDYKAVLNMWLRNIKDVYRLHRNELDHIADGDERCDRLVELNVQEQIQNLAKTSIIQRAWRNEQRPDLHGWVYGLKNGIIKPVFEMKAGTHIDPLYEYDDL